MTLLHRAVIESVPAAVKFLITNGAKLEDTDSDGWTALLLACDNASNADGEAIIKLLLDAKANVEARTGDGDTSLHRACIKGSVDVAKILASYGAKFTCLDEYGWTPLHVASSKGHVALITWMADVAKVKLNVCDRDGWTELHCACMKGHLEVVKVLLAKGSKIDAKAEDGATPLYIASGKGHADVVQYLLSAGANTEVQVGKDKLTPLNIACAKNYPQVVKMLVDKGADLDATDKNGLTALHRVAAKGLVEMVRLLLEVGADPTARGNFGSLPLDMAVDNNHMEAAAFLAAALEFYLEEEEEENGHAEDVQSIHSSKKQSPRPQLTRPRGFTAEDKHSTLKSLSSFRAVAESNPPKPAPTAPPATQVQRMSIRAEPTPSPTKGGRRRSVLDRSALDSFDVPASPTRNRADITPAPAPASAVLRPVSTVSPRQAAVTQDIPPPSKPALQPVRVASPVASPRSAPSPASPASVFSKLGLDKKAATSPTPAPAAAPVRSPRVTSTPLSKTPAAPLPAAASPTKSKSVFSLLGGSSKPTTPTPASAGTSSEAEKPKRRTSAVLDRYNPGGTPKSPAVEPVKKHNLW